MAPALALRISFMATTIASVDSREVLRCDHCSLVQFRTSNSLSRRCHKPLEHEEPEAPAPQLVVSPPPAPEEDLGIDVASAVKQIRTSRRLSQRQLAGRMQVPRTYISKIENGKAIPTLASLDRLAQALEVSICLLLRDSRFPNERETELIMADPFLSELAPFVANLDPMQRSMIINQVREMASGRRRLA